MNLEKLEIERERFGPHKGRYIAKVRVGKDRDSIQIELPPSVSEVVLNACVDELTKATETAAKEFGRRLRESIGQPPALPEPS